MKTSEPKAWRAFFASNEGYWGLFLLFFALVTHLYSIVVTGAKFWIDSIVYFQFALALFDAEQLGRLYNSHFGFQYWYVPPGLPFLIRVLDEIFGERLWPALTALQGLLSALAVTYFVLAFRNKLSRRAQLAAVIGEADGNIDNIKMTNRVPDYTEILIDLEVWDLKHLNDILAGLRAKDVVSSAARAGG